MGLFNDLKGVYNDPDKKGSLYRAITGKGQEELVQHNWSELFGNTSQSNRKPAQEEKPYVLPFTPSPARKGE